MFYELRTIHRQLLSVNPDGTLVVPQSAETAEIQKTVADVVQTIRIAIEDTLKIGVDTIVIGGTTILNNALAAIAKASEALPTGAYNTGRTINRTIVGTARAVQGVLGF